MRKIFIRFVLLICALLLSACGAEFADFAKDDAQGVFLSADEELVIEDEESAEESYTTISLFQEILLGQRQFYFDSDLIYLDKFRYGFPETIEFAVFDMDGDDVPELIIAAGETQLVYLVLHYYDGAAYGHSFVFRSMGGIKTDGTFNNSFGASPGIVRLDFIGNTYEYVFVYNFSGEIMSVEEIIQRDRQMTKEDIAWHPLSDENIDNLAALVTPRYVPPDYEIIDFITTARIHPDMPEFTFIRTLGAFVEVEIMTPEERHVTITILNENGGLIQKIDGIIQGGHGMWSVAERDMFELHFDDFNFDGYLDIWLYSAINPGTASGAWAHFWLWSPEIGQFVLNEQLAEISDMAWLVANQETRQIEVSTRGGGMGPWSTMYYEHDDREFILVAGTFTEWTRRDFVQEYMRTTHRNHITGEVTIESDPPDAAPEHIIMQIIEINPGMEFPTHDVTLRAYRLPENSEHRAQGHQYEIEITIEGRRRWGDSDVVWHDFQVIHGLLAGQATSPQNPLNLHFDDFNGDGYMDISAAGFVWVFDPEATSLHNAFVRDEALEAKMR